MTLPISVVLVTWNSGTVVEAALASLATSEPLPAELIVVDNASSDGTVAWLREHRSDYRQTHSV